MHAANDFLILFAGNCSVLDFVTERLIKSGTETPEHRALDVYVDSLCCTF